MAHSRDEFPVRIIEAYKDYRPPKYVRSAVEKLLRTVPAKYLVGLESVVLTNSTGQPRRERRRKYTHRGRRIPTNRVLAFYSPASKRKRPHIEIYVNKILTAPWWFAAFPPLRESWIGLTLFHELGHHIHYTLRPEHRDKERVADEWSERFVINFMRRKYWYLIPILVPAAWVVSKVKYCSESKRKS